MIDWRGTPRRRASLSRDLIIHSGKSTLTRLIPWPGLRAPENCRYFVMSSPLSNRLSKSLAFIKLHLFLPRATHRDDPNLLLSVSDNCGPVFPVDATYDQKPRFVRCPSSDLKKIWIIPKRLGGLKINAMLHFVHNAFVGIKLELHGIESIPKMPEESIVPWQAQNAVELQKCGCVAALPEHRAILNEHIKQHLKYYYRQAGTAGDS